MRKEYYVCGMNQLLQKILNAFPQLKNHTKFIDSISDLPDRSQLQEEVFVTMFGMDRRMLENILFEQYGIKKQHILSPSEWVMHEWKEFDDIMLRPEAIRLDASTVCQLNCRDCYMRKWNNGTVGAGFLKYENFKKLIDENDNIKEIELSNSGEVFLNPEILQIIKYSEKQGITLTAHNGNNFNDVREDVLEAIVSSKIFKNISISIDGVTQETYEQYRRGGNLEKVFTNIEKLNYYKEKYHVDSPEIIWSFILFEHNEQELPLVEDMAEKYAMKTYWKTDWSGTFRPRNPEMVKRITGFDFTKEKKAFDLNDAYNNVFCQQMFFMPQINWDGRLLGCCTQFDNDWGVNVFEEGLEKCLNGGKYKDMLLMMLGGEAVTEKTPCAGCRHFGAFKEAKYIFG